MTRTRRGGDGSGRQCLSDERLARLLVGLEPGLLRPQGRAGLVEAAKSILLVVRHGGQVLPLQDGRVATALERWVRRGAVHVGVDGLLAQPGREGVHLALDLDECRLVARQLHADGVGLAGEIGQLGSRLEREERHTWPPVSGGVGEGGPRPDRHVAQRSDNGRGDGASPEWELAPR